MGFTDFLQNKAPYGAAHFALELGDDKLGMLQSVDGGNPKTEAITYQQGGSYQRTRQPGKPKFEDIKLQVGMAMAEPIWKWMSGFMAGKGTRKDGAIVAADASYNARARREFRDAIPFEFGIPTLEGKNTGAAFVTVAFSPEEIVYTKGDGKSISSQFGLGQTMWTSNNFRFTLDGFTDDCKHVTKVDSFTIKQQVIEYPSGGYLLPRKSPGAIELPPIAFYVPEANALDLMKYFDRKNRGSGREAPTDRLQGSITVFDDSWQDRFRITFRDCYLQSAAFDKSDASSKEIKLVKFETSPPEDIKIEYLPGLLG
jgi:phage tail-like protein